MLWLPFAGILWLLETSLYGEARPNLAHTEQTLANQTTLTIENIVIDIVLQAV